MKKSNAMRIRLIGMLLTLCTLLACMAGTAMAEVVASGNCGATGSSVQWTLDDAGKLTISGSGVMEVYSVDGGVIDDRPWSDFVNSIQSVVIESGVTEISTNAFMKAKNLKSVAISDTVKMIGSFSFSGCSRLTSVTIPASVVFIQDNAFAGCSSLTTVNVPCNWNGSLYNFGESVKRTVHIKEPSYTQDGDQHVATYSCCGAIVTEDHIRAEDTTYTDNKDGTHSFTCCVCDGVVIEPHSFNSATGKCAAQCGADMAVASVTIAGETTYYATLNEALTAARGEIAKVDLLKDAETTGDDVIDSYVTFNGGKFTVSGKKLTNTGTIVGGTFTATVINMGGSVTGGSFVTLSCYDGSVSGEISFRTLVNGRNVLDYDLSQAVDIEGATVKNNTMEELPVSKLKLPDGYVLEVGGQIVSVLQWGEVGTIVAHSEHTYVDGVCVCGLAATYTLALAEDVAGVEIESVSIDGEELILGGEIRVQHGKDLTVKLKNTLSDTQTDVFAAACTSAGNTIEHTFDGADTLTIPGGSVNQNIYISAVPYVRVQFNLNGGMVTDAGKAKFSSLGCTWDKENDALKAMYDTEIDDLSAVFRFGGHTFIGVKADGSDDVVSALDVRGDTTVDVLWKCAAPNFVEAVPATCQTKGSIAHYACVCDKLYAEDKTTELTAEQIRTPVDPDAHSINAQTGSCVYCGKFVAVASVTIGGVTTYYAKLDEALNAPNGMTATVKLLKDAEITEDHTIPMGVTFDGGKFTVSGEDLVNLDGTIAGGTFKAKVTNMDGSIAGGVFDWIRYCEGSVYGPISFKHLVNFGHSPSINLSQAVSIEGANISTTTSALSVSDLKLPDGYALEVNGQIVSTLQSDQGGTIVAHLEHNYVDGVCGCGAECDHAAIDNDGKCTECGLQYAASVTIGGETTYYTELDDALDEAVDNTATVKLLADGVIKQNVNYDPPSNITLDMNGKTITAQATLSVTEEVPLTITGSGIINADGATPIMITAGVVTVTGDLTFNGAEPGFAFDYPGTLDLSGVTGSIDGWRVMNICTDDEIAVGDSILLPDGYALKVGDNFAASLNCNETGTIVAHSHEYTTKDFDTTHHWEACVCGAKQNVTEHTLIATPNAGEENHSYACACGYQVASPENHTFDLNAADEVVCDCSAKAVASVTIENLTAYYANFANAVSVWNRFGDTLTLLADVSYDSQISLSAGATRTFAGGDYTLDLGSCNISNLGTLTIESGTIKAAYRSNGVIYNWSTLHIRNATINNTNNFAVANAGKLTAEDSTLTGNNGFCNYNGASAELTRTTLENVICSDDVTLTDCTITADLYSITYSGGILTINGDCAGWHVYASSASAAVGTEIILPADYYLFDGDKIVTMLENATATIGKHTADDHAYGYDNITATTHDYVCTVGCGAGETNVPHTFTENAAGEWMCECSAQAVAKVDDAYFADFAGAVAAWEVESARTMTLLADVTYGDVIQLKSGDAKTLDLNGKTLTSTAMANYALSHNNVPLTIKDSGTDGAIHSGGFYSTSVVHSYVGKLTLESGTFAASGNYPLSLTNTAAVNSSHVTLQGNVCQIWVKDVLGSEPLTITGDGCDGWKIWNNMRQAVPISIPAGFHLEDNDGNALEKNTELPASAYTVIRLSHVHEWTYAADDDADTITATCANTDGRCSDPEQSLTLSAADAVYSGTTVEATVTGDSEDMTYELCYTQNGLDYTDAVVNAGSYTAEMEAGGVRVSASFTISPKDISTSASCQFSLEEDAFTYSGAEPVLTVIAMDNGRMLTDYETGAVQTGAGSHKLTVTGTGNYTGSVELDYTIAPKPLAISSAVIEDVAYDPAGYTLTVKEVVFDGVVEGETLTIGEDGDYTAAAELTGENAANDAAEATVTVTLTNSNYSLSEPTAEATFRIMQSGTDMTAVTDRTEYIYGDEIIVSGSVEATGREPEQETLSLKRAFVAPAAMQAALYDAAGNQITEPVSVVDGEYELTYDTKSKLVAPGESLTLTVQFTGNASMANQKAQTNRFALKAKELTAVSAQAEDRTYEPGNVSVVITGVTVEGIFDTDEVSVDTANLSGAIASDNAGTYTSVSLSGLVLAGADAAFYTAIDAQTQTSVTIHPKEVTLPEITLDEDEFVYDGTEKKPTVVSVKDGENEIPAAEYTVSYEANVEAGTAKVIITDAEGGNYTVSGEKEFSIVTSDTAMTAETDQEEYTYGDAIIVSGSVEATGKEPEQETLSLKRAFVAPAAMQAALYDAAGNQITEPVSVVDGEYELTYDTKSKLVAPGESLTLTVQFTGNASMANQKAQTNRFALKAKELTAVSAQAEDRTYEPGNVSVVVTGVTVEGIFDTDEVSVDTANLSGAIASDNAGTYTSVSLSGLVLAGADAAFYTAIDAQAQTSVTIYPKKVTLPEITLDEDEFVYDGTEKKPNVVSVKDGENEIPAAEYTVSYEANVEAGTAKVIITDAEGGNYTVSGEKEFSIVTSDTAMTAETDQAEYTYGDAIIVSGSVTATGKEPQATGFSLLRAFIAPAAMQAALYDAAGNQITEPVSVVDGKYELTYDTMSKLVAPGEDIVLTVQFTGNASMANQKAQTNRFALKAKELTPELSGSTAKTYDAGTDVTDASNLAFTLKEVFEGDSMTAEAASFAFEDANAGTGKNVIAQGIVLSGKDAQFYQLAENTAQAAVGTITPAAAPEIIFPTAGGITYGQALESSALTGGSTEHGSFAWQDGTVVPPAGSGSYTVVFTPKDALNYDYTAVEGWNAETGTVERTVVIAVAKAAGEVRVTIEGWVYGAEPNAPVPESATHGTQNVTFLYKAKDADESAYSAKVPSQVGEYTVKAIFAETENYLQASAEADFAITMSQTTFDGGLGVYNGDKETMSFTYGDTITVKAKPMATGESVLKRLWRSSVSADKMALFAGDVQLSEETAANADGMYEMTYDTAQKLLPLGESSITAKYVSDGNKDDYSQSVNVTIAKKELTVSGVSAKDRIFKAGNTKVTVTGVTLCGVVGSDEVYTEVKTGDTGSDQIGTYENVTLPAELELKGADAQWYTISGGASVPANGESGVRILAVPDDLALRVSLNGELTDSDLSEALVEAGYSTVEEVLAAFEAALGKPKGSTVSELLELQLHYTEDGGETWIEAGAEHFPKGETLLVSLPVPEGTDPKTHTYHVTVMYTEDMNGHRAGEIRQIEATPRLKEDGTWVLDVQVDGLVLMLVRAKANPAALPETGDSSSLALWMTMMGVSLLAMGCLRRRRAL